MRKFVLAILILLIPAFLWANNAERIEELKKQMEAVAVEINQYQQALQQKQIELIKLQGAIEELQRQDDKNENITPISN